MKLLCWLGLHHWMIEHRTLAEEAAYCVQHNRLPTLYAHCARCHKRRVLAP